MSGFKDFLSTILKPFTSKLDKIASGISSFSLSAGKRRTAVALVALVTLALTLFFTISIFGQSTFTRTIGSHGTVTVVGMGVYWDSNCGNAVFSIDWGIIEPGLAKHVTVYVRNEGNDAVTLFLGTENWNPENASNYLKLSWDYAGENIRPDETVQVTLTLLASPDMEGITGFGFDIIISSNG